MSTQGEPKAGGSGLRFIRAADLVWLGLFAALALAAASPTTPALVLLIALAAMQIAEGRVPWLGSSRGIVAAVLIRLGICYLLIGWTGGISSTFYLSLLLPVTSAATTLNAAGAFVTVVLACLSYLSFLLYVDWTKYEFTPEAITEVSLRTVFLPVVAFLTHQLAQQNRVEARRYQSAAAELEAANRSLQAAEAAVRRSERLAALGQLTAGLAHEIRNPLGTVRASAEMLGRTVPAVDSVRQELAGFIASEVDRANSLITRFLEFARPLHLRLADVDLTDVIDRAVEEVGRRHPPLPVTFHRNYSPDLPRVPLDAELMQRVFYNLLTNAAEATQEGGDVSIKVRAAGDYIEASVIDRGRGILPEHIETIFNPFFTTRTDGTGLGLAIVSRIVDEHGGRVAAESRPGEGSVFRVYLPRLIERSQA